MNLKPLAANMTEVKIGNKMVLFSYQTPVAYAVDNVVTVYVTDKFWSRTTSRHINKWLASLNRDMCISKQNQEYFDNLLNEVK